MYFVVESSWDDRLGFNDSIAWQQLECTVSMAVGSDFVTPEDTTRCGRLVPMPEHSLEEGKTRGEKECCLGVHHGSATETTLSSVSQLCL